MKRFLIVTFLVLLCQWAKAEPVEELTQFTREQVGLISTALAAEPGGVDSSLGPWELKRFLLRVTAKVGFDIEALKLELLPELELVWQKELSEDAS